ncbi:uncharacterized protein LOC143146777 isoform X1 [Ptiloglossa arizonensis]|uniref:uncharacterized protein LOC143146777 isoform X1 n=1 Tax=Ptiloglossa arizonensis TaxID=3350558 RepID=UPI003F9F086F
MDFERKIHFSFFQAFSREFESPMRRSRTIAIERETLKALSDYRDIETKLRERLRPSLQLIPPVPRDQPLRNFGNFLTTEESYSGKFERETRFFLHLLGDSNLVNAVPERLHLGFEKLETSKGFESSFYVR